MLGNGFSQYEPLPNLINCQILPHLSEKLSRQTLPLTVIAVDDVCWYLMYPFLHYVKEHVLQYKSGADYSDVVGTVSFVYRRCVCPPLPRALFGQDICLALATHHRCDAGVQL